MVRTENEDDMRAYCLNCGEIFVFDAIGVPEGLPLSNPMFCIPCFEFVGDFPTEIKKQGKTEV